MTSPHRQAKRYDSLTDFYQDVYGRAVREVRSAGRTGASLILAEQTAGDWSDAPTPDLSIGMALRYPATSDFDLGAGRFRACPMPQGSFIVVPPNAGNRIVVNGEHTIRVLAVPYGSLLALAGSDAGFPSDGDFGRLHAGFHLPGPVSGLVDRLWSEALDGSPHGALLADTLLLQLGLELLRLRDNRQHRRGGLAPWQVRRVTECLEAHLADDLPLAALAKLVGLSPNHFCTAFRISLGEPPHRWLVRCRIERAKKLLADPRPTITDVALAVGFGSSAHFATAFRKQVGVTPSDYRRERLL